MLGMRRDKKRQKGFAIIYVSLIGAFVLIPMAGLAIDFGIVYNVKARLQTACDAAAIGAGYLLHATTNLSNQTQYDAITTAAQQFFNANYPTGYMASTLQSYSAVPASATSGKTITVNATATVPMLFMRVLGIANSTVAAEAVSNVRYIAMMIVVDRSGSVYNENAGPTIQNALDTFVASSTSLVDGVDTVGMLSFGATWHMDFSPVTHFQTNSPSIGTAITDLDFASTSATNTAEGLYQAWTELHELDLPGSLNVIVLLTDGRPSAFTGSFAVKSSCNGGSNIKGNLQSYVSQGTYPFWPPPTSNSNNIIIGLLQTQLTGSYPSWGAETSNVASPNSGCQFASNTANVPNDLASGAFPSTVGPVDNVGSSYNSAYPYYTTPGTGVSTQKGYPSTLAGYYNSPGTSASDPQNVRYAAFNVADNIATMIREDTTLSPMIFVVGLNYSGTSTEPLDADWLARVANDPTYITVGSDTNVVASGLKVYQTGQTAGMYCNSTEATLAACFAQVTNALLRLTQ
jgi:von Willebrand factor type A domain/Putative Flp pilus-assembly TadE/G-like